MQSRIEIEFVNGKLINTLRETCNVKLHVDARYNKGEVHNRTKRHPALFFQLLYCTATTTKIPLLFPWDEKYSVKFHFLPCRRCEKTETRYFR